MNRKNLVIGVGAVVLVILISGLFRKDKNPSQEKTAMNTLSAKELYARATALREDRRLLEAKEAYQQILADYPDLENIDRIDQELEDINMDVIFSNVVTPSTAIHDVQIGDTLGKLAKKYGTTIDLIRINNNLRNNIIRIGQKLRVWNKPFSILVDKSQNILILKQGNEVVKVYDVSTGENNSTPVGTFKIETKLVDPVWFNRGVVVPPESPENVLGSRWLGFDLPGYGIHGTVEPDSIGNQVTAGCVRMRNDEVEELYSIIPTGVEVVVVD